MKNRIQHSYLLLILFVSLAFTCNAQNRKKDKLQDIKDNFSTQNVVNEDSVLAFSEKMPEFPGGKDAGSKFTVQNLRYPRDAQEKNQQGRVIVQFVVSKTGKIINPKVVKSVVPTLDNEALRLVKSFPDWIPGEQNGQKVSVYQVIPVTFKLDGAPNANTDWVPDKNILVVIDTLKMPLKFNIDVLNPEMVDTGFVLKPNPIEAKIKLIEQYGPLAEKGVILIKTLKNKFILLDSITSKLGVDNIIETNVDVFPHFKGGDKGLLEYISKNLNYPLVAMEEGVSGTVYVRFVVDKNGKVVNPTVIKKIHPLLDAEALRVVKSLPDFIPAESNGQKVNVYVNAPIGFRIEGAGSVNQRISRGEDNAEKLAIVLDGSILPEGFDLNLLNFTKIISYNKQIPTTQEMKQIFVTKFGKNASKGVILIKSNRNNPDLIESDLKEKDSLGNTIHDKVEQMPKFPGGEIELIKYIYKNLQYPAEAKKQKIQGRVILRFVINTDGKTQKIEVLDSADPLLNQEAIRIVSFMPAWIPGKQNGINVPVYYTLPIIFKKDGVKIPKISTEDFEKVKDYFLGMLMFTNKFRVEEEVENIDTTKTFTKYLTKNDVITKQLTLLMSTSNQVPDEKYLAGRIVVEFTISKFGYVKDIVFRTHSCPRFELYVSATLKGLQRIQPAKFNDKNIDVKYVLSINYDVDESFGEAAITENSGKTPKITKNALIVFDGEKMPPDFDLKKINPDSIFSFRALNSDFVKNHKKFIRKYGEEAKNGIVFISSRKNMENYLTEKIINPESFNIAYEYSPLANHGFKDPTIQKYLKDNLTCPKEADSLGIGGRVVAKFDITDSVHVKNIQIVTTAHPLLDNEVIRLIKSMDGNSFLKKVNRFDNQYCLRFNFNFDLKFYKISETANATSYSNRYQKNKSKYYDPLIIIDSITNPKFDLTKMNEMNIASFIYLNPEDKEDLIKKFGLKAQNGVIEIKTANKDSLSNKKGYHIYDFGDKLPEFSEGANDLYTYIEKNRVYPKDSYLNLESGDVEFRFVVSEKGKVQDIELIKGVSKSLNEEALRIVKSFPEWTPGEDHGVKVPMHQTVRIRFNFDDESYKL